MTDTPAPTVVIKTSEGDIKLELFADQAPKTVENFLSYVKDGHYNGTIFHRVIEGFMIQGGGYNADLDEKPTREPIENEAKADVKNSRGTIAMARTMEVDSATAQFFINLVDNSFLDHKEPTQAAFGYCVFGRVIDGMDIVDAIGAKATGTSGFMRDVPKEPITIEEISEVSMIHE